MNIINHYNEIGKGNMKATRTNFMDKVGEASVRDIVKEVLLGENVRDFTEFITQKRLIDSYSAMLDLYMKHIGKYTESIDEFSEYIMEDYFNTRGKDKKLLNLWLLGLTSKGLDNITRDNLDTYHYSFSTSMEEIVENLETEYGELSGTIELQGGSLELNWNILSLLFLAVGAQTLTIRGSAKSMNGKMFEKLILGTLLKIMGFTYLPEPPGTVRRRERIFWLSNMDENERETDATVAYNGKAVSIDIGFIGKGNPEITLDKVTRFGAYKEIGGLPHDMETIIIVDTVAENSDLINKAERVNGHVLQMKNKDWTINFARTLCEIMQFRHELEDQRVEDLKAYYDERLPEINMREFIW